jgi:hypothetical protein
MVRKNAVTEYLLVELAQESEAQAEGRRERRGEKGIRARVRRMQRDGAQLVDAEGRRRSQLVLLTQVLHVLNQLLVERERPRGLPCAQ